MGWAYKHSNFFGAKVWLDIEGRKILLSESYGRNKKVFDFSEIKRVSAGSARSSSNHAIYFSVNDLKKPEYMVEFGFEHKRDEWMSRLLIALDMH
jgi:hypothetical protein